MNRINRRDFFWTIGALGAAGLFGCPSMGGRGPGARVEDAIWKVVVREVNRRLNEKGISFSNGDVVFRQEPIIAPQRVNTGHSCTHQAWIEGSHAEVRFASSASLTFDGNSAGEPQLLMLSLPVSVYARIGLKETWGNRLAFGNCNNHAEDNYYGDFSINTTIRQLMALSLQPALLSERTPQGDYQIKIKPIFTVAGQLENFNAQFGVHNRDNFFSAFMTFLSGTASFLGEGGLALYRFDANAFVDALKTSGIDLAQVAGSVFLGLDGDVLGIDSVEKIAGQLAETRIKREFNGLTHRFEEETYQKIASALKLDANGERVFVVRREVLEVLS